MDIFPLHLQTIIHMARTEKKTTLWGYFSPQGSKTNKCSPLAPSTPIHFATRLNQMQLDSVQWDLMGSEQALCKQALIGPILYKIVSSFHHMTLNCKVHFSILE